MDVGRGEVWEEASVAESVIRRRLIVANLAGAALVAIVAVVVGVPDAGDAAHGTHLALAGGLILGGYLGVVLPVEIVVSRGRARRTFGWVGERRQPTPTEVDRVLTFPWVQARAIFGWWLGGAVLNVVVNLGLGTGVAYGLRNGLHIALGGLTSSALSFLLLERFNRPAFTLALGGEPAESARRLGLRRRLLLTWALGAAVPVLLIISAPVGMSDQRRLDLAGPLVAIGAVALVGGLVLTLVASRSIVDPIEVLRSAQRRVEDGELEVDVAVDDVGEVGLLQAGFNRMVAGLRERQKLRDLFGRHVGAEVAQRALSGQVELGGEVRDASVLFVDLIGSTSLAQRLPPEQVVAMLNQFFAVVVRCTESEGGWVNKFEGDAALCVFGPPAADAGHAARALRAARRLQAELAGLAEQHPGVVAGIGVSTGSVVAGNVGAENRYEYTVIGDPVNEAARLTEEAKQVDGRLLASGASIAAAPDEATRWRPFGAWTLRGRAGPTDVFVPADQ